MLRAGPPAGPPAPHSAALLLCSPLLCSALLSVARLCSSLLSFVLLCSPSLPFALLFSPSLSFALLRSPFRSFALLRSSLLYFALLCSPLLAFALLCFPWLSYPLLCSPLRSCACLCSPLLSFARLCSGTVLKKNPLPVHMSTQVFLGWDSGRITLKQLQNCLKTVLNNDPKNAPKRTTTHHNTAQHTQNTHNVHHEQLLRHFSTTYQHTYCVHLAVRLYYALHLAVRLYYALIFMHYVHFVLNVFGCLIDHFHLKIHAFEYSRVIQYYELYAKHLVICFNS